ncbi:TPA: chromosome segregation protein SMC [Methanocaldococcus jannaschii]|uniref:Chromosome partition protein Smc n=2 Tax=Methanocaldococcus jannaschii TaxID=2190 RepID=SMC_METJA|nr:chromosome segregation protein SMC [Methanocaldococcus jannaschii]Q59037.2 RecName: Full=Chromosome partition protein Smc [Methanocaldococcus jannaschii DSM 2661]AAB99663.1 chromosome segretation protein (smc1) [Methanocaldococcus jannaschii DSM 2661]HII59413.1 chromosome segregation protein SMC [Methanocaldococcus jannaschii]
MVTLEKIELKNFKSFKKLSLDIPKGFTAIVGPNGSGKSNIVDAILFVLGKTSAKKLRANRFSGLITYHNGKRADFAEVCLYFTNENNAFNVNADKVGILRRIKSSGETDYYLVWKENDKEKRKKMTKHEIIDLFRRLGLLGDNVISQGDLLKIINISPIERRKIIDEISGIAEFDEKKKKAEEELKKARELIEMIDIRISEVENNLKKLKKEKEDAEKYIKLNEELKAAKYALILKKVSYLNVLLENIQNDIKNLEELKNEFLSKVREIDVEIENLKLRLNNIINELNEKGNEEVLELHKSIKELEVEIENDKKVLDSSINELKKVEVEIENKKKEIKETQKKIIENRDSIIEKEQQIKEIEEKIKNLNYEKERLKEAIAESESIIKHLKESEMEIADEIAKNQNELYRLKKELNDLDNLINRKNFEIEKNNEMIKKLKEELETVEDVDTKPLYLELENLNVEIEFSKRGIKELEEKKKELQAKLDELHAEYVKENARIKALKEMEELSMDRAIREILNANLPGIIDIVGNLGKTKIEYKTAIEVAAGNRLNHIVVKRMDDAVRAIKYLKERKLGRATFLPLDRIEGREAYYIDEDGVIGRAIDLVEFDEKYRRVFEYVFGNTVVVENIDIAKELAKKYRKVRFVTLDGDVIEPSGAMIGGTFKSKAKIKVDVDLSKLNKIADEIIAIESELRKIKEEIERLSKIVKRSSAKKMEIENTLEIIKKNEMRKREIAEKNTIKIKELELKNKDILEELEELNLKREEILNRINEIESKINELIERREKIINELKEYESDENLKRMNEIEGELKILEKEKAKLKNEIDKGLTLVKEILIPKIEELNKKVSELINKKVILEKNISFYKESIEKNLSILEEKRKRYEELAKNLKELTEKKEQLEKEIETLERERREILRKVRDIENRINELMVEKAKYESKLEEEERKLYLCEKVDVSKELEKKDIEELEIYIGELENEIKSLEPVNMRAIEDYNYVAERYKELIEKRKEYERDEKKYLQLMEELENKKKEVFMEVFNKVAKNFEEVYKEIGGIGKLSLENEKNPFEGGILIDASPRGKKLLSLDAMSGGEKSLTALAFLFAIQRLNPSPFYVLDEVDAALDVKNVSLIADMIKNASKDSQFIVISHREQMVSKADVVYGVYMENGLSKVVGIRL